jgi:hypothetical protein
LDEAKTASTGGPETSMSSTGLFAGCMGRGAIVAVIDSGVHPGHDHIDARRLGPGIMVIPDGTIADGPDVWLDRLGHGTAVTAAIQEKAPEAICLPVRVFRDSLKTSATALIAAIGWAVGQRADIVNLSLGTMNEAHRAAFAAAVAEAAAAGTLVVAARDMDGAPCYPGALDGVAGVGLDWECPRSLYRAQRHGEQIDFLASGYPRPIPGVPLQRNVFGISFAVAQISGFAALARERLAPGMPLGRVGQEIRRLLEKEVAEGETARSSPN